MSDSPFQRPGSEPHSNPQIRSPLATETVPIDFLDSDATPPTPVGSGGRSGHRTRVVVAVGIAGVVLGGLGAVAVTLPPRSPDPVPVTMDSFPREILGKTREDVPFRDAGATAVVERLDAQFEDQLQGYRFTHGGDGARLDYGDVYYLTLTNGWLSPNIPTAGDPTRWEPPTVVTLHSTNTKCVAINPFIDPAQPDADMVVVAETGELVDYEFGEPLAWSDCVLVDTDRNFSLRLEGDTPVEDIFRTADEFRDELQRIHADLVD